MIRSPRACLAHRQVVVFHEGAAEACEFIHRSYCSNCVLVAQKWRARKRRTQNREWTFAPNGKRL